MSDPILAFLLGLLVGVVACCFIVRTIRLEAMARFEAEAVVAHRAQTGQRRVRNPGTRPRVVLARASR